MGDEAFLSNILLFSRMVQRAGIAVGLEQRLELLRALEWVDLGSREQVFHTCRSLLLRRHDQLGLFALLFNRFWRRHVAATARPRQQMPRAPRHRPDRTGGQHVDDDDDDDEGPLRPVGRRGPAHAPVRPVAPSRRRRR